MSLIQFCASPEHPRAPAVLRLCMEAPGVPCFISLLQQRLSLQTISRNAAFLQHFCLSCSEFCLECFEPFPPLKKQQPRREASASYELPHARWHLPLSEPPKQIAYPGVLPFRSTFLWPRRCRSASPLPFAFLVGPLGMLWFPDRRPPRL